MTEGLFEEKAYPVAKRDTPLKHIIKPGFGALCGTTPGQFHNFQILFVKRRFASRGKVVNLAAHTKLPSLMAKSD